MNAAVTAMEAAQALARKIDAKGGRAYFVGGYVRDKLLGIENDDLDIEVHGIDADILHSVLEETGAVKTVGASFGIYLLTEYGIDVAMPRKEKCTGGGHRDFEVNVDPHLGIVNAARRRDFTVNAMLEDVLTHEIIDPFGGREDLQSGILRHVDDASFPEDPLRVLRACRFASRFNFKIAEKTLVHCRNTDLSLLPPERINEELRKTLTVSDKPGIFFEYLRAMGKLTPWFSELTALIGLEQNELYHPEGDVWTHTMECLDRAAAVRDRASDPYKFMLLALTHDLGKTVTTERINGTVHSYGHETAGAEIIDRFISRITRSREILRYLRNMVPLHMKPNVMAHDASSIKKTNKMFDEALEPSDLVLFAAVDRPRKSDEYGAFLRERLRLYEDIMARPYITAKDLISAGIAPGEKLGSLLELAHKLRLAGTDKDAALRQILGEARKMQEPRDNL